MATTANTGRVPGSVWVLLAAVVVLAGAMRAFGQVQPDRTYYGIDREIPVTVRVPADAQGEPAIVLLTRDGEERARADVLAGKVDLAAFFPMLWEREDPELLYAQLVVDGRRIGPGLVLQPMVTPRRATPGRQGGRPAIQWRSQGDVYSGLRAYVDQLLRLRTTEGEVLFRLRPDHAPNTVWHIRELVRGGFYTDIAFHRIVPEHPSGHPFVIQVGDPVGSGSGGPGVFIDLEPSELEHRFGVLSMARTSDPDTNGSQFFIALSREATVHLDDNYTAFGEAVAGAEVIAAIASTPLADAASGRPEQAPRIVEATLVNAPPRGEGRQPASRPTPRANPRR